METRGQKRSETIDELPADKRTCSSFEFRPSSSSSVSPIETPTTSTNHTQDHDMDSSSSASGSGGSHEDRDSAYGSCDSDEMDDGENRRQREALREIQRQRLPGDASKFKNVFKNLNEKSDESAQQAALHELCELLSFSSDSTLSSLIADTLSPMLIKLAGHQSNPEIMLLSIRAVTYLCDIYPRSAGFIVRHEGVPVLCQRLLAIEYEDVAEQCLLALEKISREQPLACLQSGAITAVLTYIDFFSTSIQRVALSTVVNICQKLPSEGSSSYMDAVPTLCKLLQYEDNQLVEHVANCLIKITEQVYQLPNMLDELSKHGLIHQVAHLIDLKSHTTLSQSVHTGLIGLLVKLASGSMVAVEALFDLNISSILKDILSTYDLSHGMPSPRAFDGQDNQVHEVLKLLIQLVPVVSRNHDVQLAEEKAAFLTNNPRQLQAFGNDMLPVLIQVVDSGVDLSICYGCLSVIDKLLYYISSDKLLDLFKQTNISRFLAGVFTRKDRHILMLALNISDTILKKDGDIFMGPFIKEGVLFAIDALISPEKGSQFMFSMFNDIHLSNRSSHKQCLCYSFNVIPSSVSESQSCKLEKDSVQTLAKHVRTYYFDLNSSTSANGTTDILEKLKTLSVELASVTDGMVEDEYEQVLNRIMSCLDGGDVISTFEFVESGITESLFNYLSPGECARKSKSISSGSKSQPCMSEQRLETFGRLFWSKFSLASFISKLQSALSSVEDFPVFLNGVFKHRSSYATVPNRHATTYPCLKVLFEKGEGESNLIDYSGDLQNADPFADFDALEKYLWPKVCSRDTKRADETGSNGQSSSDSSQQNIGQTSAESESGNETQNDPMDYEMTATQNESDFSADGQLSFYLEGKPIDRKLTIYQAILKHHKEVYDTITHSTLWNQIHKITYKKSSIFDRSRSPVSDCHTCLSSDFGSSVKKSTPCHNILFLLRILENVNRSKFHIMSRARICDYAEGRISELDGVKPTTGGILKNEFVNTRLTEKLEQQLRDTLATSAGGMPSWCAQLMTSCPFLFSFEARCKYFKLSALGKHQGQRQPISRSGSDSENESPRSRKKFLVYRDRVLESATKMMNLHASQKVVLEVKYDDEVGTGLGPTLEFFTLVSNEFQKPGLGMWRGDNLLSNASLQSLENPDSVIGGSPFGLFPGPWCPSVSGVDFSEVRKKFVLLGQIVAKALYDGRVLDLPFTKAFYKLVLGQELTVYDIKSFDPVLGKTLIEFQALVERRKYLQSVGENSTVDLDMCFRDTKIEDLHLDFTLPGYPNFILGSRADKEMVNTTNLGEYIELVVDATIKSGISKQMEAFKSGFNQVFSIDHLQIFTDEELERLLCGESETWNPNQLLDLVKFDHGYTSSSPAILHFLEVIQEFDYEQQKAFVKFVTGAPRLPLGGLASLNPKLTIVRKHCDKFVDADLPSVMTCANYLKLPPYSSKQIMKEKLLYAITEGQGSFHLS